MFTAAMATQAPSTLPWTSTLREDSGKRPLPQYITTRSTLGNTTAAHCGNRSDAEAQAVSLVEACSSGLVPSLILDAWWLYEMLLTYGRLPFLYNARFNISYLLKIGPGSCDKSGPIE